MPHRPYPHRSGRKGRLGTLHESTEIRKDVSLMDENGNRKHGGYGNRGRLCDIFILFGDNAEFFCSFFYLRDRQSDEETCVDGIGNVWSVLDC